MLDGAAGRAQQVKRDLMRRKQFVMLFEVSSLRPLCGAALGERLEDRPDVRPTAQVGVGAIFGAATLPQRERLGVTFGRDRRLELFLDAPVLGA